MQTNILINCERFGMCTRFATLEEARDAVRACGPEFSKVTLSKRGMDVIDNRGEVVGRVVAPLCTVNECQS